ncbi:LPD16 domain-containing protein [Pseudobutyrivibrio xylanivorans]|uniref:Antirestriction protein ArdC n=1 Tax=Pseudobutyrivibrio xylanivorans DSM 14809 TaxID=1123012 RepID=A0A1M6KXZ6_PSEXY|nr:LPD16 domain-containing protein [Pseudobutyrivibrio xylanivorans]SHJ63825.1 protein of unknown function [Pseudobutyrivibrio xylanivorans DSM 14809]
MEVKEITEKLEQGLRDLFNSEKYKTYLTTMSKFHNYSFNNTLLIAMQRPDASLVAGYGAWQKNFERHVKKGAKGIKIISPVKVKVEVEDDKTDKDGAKKTIEVTKFKVSTVFDVSDTEGKELPKIGVDMLSGQVEKFNQLTKAVAEISKVPIEYRDIEGGAKGFYSQKDNKIVVQKDMTQAQTLKTLIHELAHSILHGNLEKGDESEAHKKDRRTKEVEAESVAYAVCQHFGVDTSDYSFGYIAGWSSGKEMEELKSSMQTIRRTANEVIHGIETEIRIEENAKEFETTNDEVAFKIGKEYLAVQKTDGGFDYTIYDESKRVKDGGVIDRPNASIAIVVADIVVSELMDTSAGVKKIDFDSLQEDAHYAAAYDMKNAIADKKPSVLDQLKERFSGKDNKIFGNKKDEPSI